MKILRKLKSFLPLFVFFVVTVIFYSQSIFNQKVPVPADILLGAYYPWLDYDWGYPVSMPVKNPLISDIYSQFYPWKSIIAESYKNFEFPLWNQYSYSGYPLLANFNSGALNPLNILMLIFGDQTGWLLMLMAQMFLSMVSIYYFLKTSSKNIFPNLTASIIYGLSAFAICWSQFMNAGFAMIYFPLILYLIKQKKYILLPFVYFLLMTSGHMQAFIYGVVFSMVYFLFENWHELKLKIILPYIFAVIIGFGYMAIQIFPTLELSARSIRFSENYISAYNYGLLPLSKFITFLSPDYFGNPATNNYWGFFNYHETIIYQTILGFIAIVYFAFNLKKTKSLTRFFIFSSFIVLILIFDNPISRLIYFLKIPYIYTSAAARIVFLLTASVPIIIRDFLDELSENIDSHRLKLSLILTFSLIGSQLLITIILKKYFIYFGTDFEWYKNLNTSFRNTFLYLIICLVYLSTIYISTKIKPFIYFLFIIVFIEQLRFGWKYLPFVDRNFVFATTPVIEFLKNDPEKYFRIMAQKGPILPANSWAIYRLSSPMGYDPLAIKDYFVEFNQEINSKPNDTGVSRYLEPEKYPADLLGKYNVKYLLTLKYDKGDYISESGQVKLKIDETQWEKAFEDRSVVVMKNNRYQSRVVIESLEPQSQTPTASINSYSSTSVKIKYFAPTQARLTLNDSWFPGWVAKNNGQVVDFEHNSHSRSLVVSGEGIIEYRYQPKSFTIGLSVSVIFLMFHLVFYLEHRHD